MFNQRLKAELAAKDQQIATLTKKVAQLEEILGFAGKWAKQGMRKQPEASRD